MNSVPKSTLNYTKNPESKRNEENKSHTSTHSHGLAQSEWKKLEEQSTRKKNKEKAAHQTAFTSYVCFGAWCGVFIIIIPIVCVWAWHFSIYEMPSEQLPTISMYFVHLVYGLCWLHSVCICGDRFQWLLVTSIKCGPFRYPMAKIECIWFNFFARKIVWVRINFSGSKTRSSLSNTFETMLFDLCPLQISACAAT